MAQTSATVLRSKALRRASRIMRAFDDFEVAVDEAELQGACDGDFALVLAIARDRLALRVERSRPVLEEHGLARPWSAP